VGGVSSAWRATSSFVTVTVSQTAASPTAVAARATADKTKVQTNSLAFMIP
jgi:hypothetical protein